jgi:hypothetical protein
MVPDILQVIPSLIYVEQSSSHIDKESNVLTGESADGIVRK